MSSRGRADIDPSGGQPYSAAAMSLVFHSAHPLVPTLRADVRLFQVCLRMLSCFNNDLYCGSMHMHSLRALNLIADQHACNSKTPPGGRPVLVWRRL